MLTAAAHSHLPPTRVNAIAKNGSAYARCVAHEVETLAGKHGFLKNELRLLLDFLQVFSNNLKLLLKFRAFPPQITPKSYQFLTVSRRIGASRRTSL
jgi:hypothetical protein